MISSIIIVSLLAVIVYLIQKINSLQKTKDAYLEQLVEYNTDNHNLINDIGSTLTLVEHTWGQASNYKPSEHEIKILRILNETLKKYR